MSTAVIQEKGLAFGSVGKASGFEDGDKILKVDGKYQPRFDRMVLDVLLGDASVLDGVKEEFDVVIANINRNILLNDMTAFRSHLKTGGRLILSGFYEEDIPVLLENAAELGLHETNRHVDNNWACLVLGE